MSPLLRALVEKAGNDHGFEHILSGEDDVVCLASARHRAKARVMPVDSQFLLVFTSPSIDLLNAELARSFPALTITDGEVVAGSHDVMAQLLRRAAELAHALPNQAAQDFDATLKQELDGLPAALKGTEVERMIRQRIGQQAFRSAMLDYWGGTCAVTGISVPEVLRASHAKPWSECVSDAERLDVFNGFLLSANLDALFDRFLISFADNGEMVFSPTIAAEDRASLGLTPGLRLRWLTTEHLHYLQFHRSRFQAGV